MEELRRRIDGRDSSFAARQPDVRLDAARRFKTLSHQAKAGHGPKHEDIDAIIKITPISRSPLGVSDIATKYVDEAIMAGAACMPAVPRVEVAAGRDGDFIFLPDLVAEGIAVSLPANTSNIDTIKDNIEIYCSARPPRTPY